MKTMKKLTIFFLTIFLFLFGLLSYGQPLKFRKDGTFKIVQFSDFHLIDQSPKTAQTVATIQFVLEAEKPDMVMITGDLAFEKPTQEPLKLLANLFDEAKMPFAVVFGNHDVDQIPKEEAWSILSSTPYFLSEQGPKEVSGLGNYILPVRASKSEKTAILLYGFDSGYQGIQPSHVAWYRSESARLTAENGGYAMPALAFLHIAFLEFSNLIADSHTVGTYAQRINDIPNPGIFDAFVDMKDVMGVFVGHCHDNDAIGQYRNIALSFCRKSGADTYGALEKGARVIELYEDKPRTFRSWIREPSGAVNMFSYPSVTGDEGKKLDKTGWTVEVSSEDATKEYGGKNAILDGIIDANNCWAWGWNTTKVSPHWIIIDMKKAVEVGKIVTTRSGRYTHRYVKTLNYFIGNSADVNGAWTPIATGAYPDRGSDNWRTHVLSLNVNQSATGRYLKLLMDDSFVDPTQAAISEIDVYSK
ncbi:hypothetical protein FACS1894199_07030 [Bacteroidia bacterium]|nr:hypothetical protein FACS1894199_07030 [Bacteroidia bacterium]